VTTKLYHIILPMTYIVLKAPLNSNQPIDHTNKTEYLEKKLKET